MNINQIYTNIYLFHKDDKNLKDFQINFSFFFL